MTFNFNGKPLCHFITRFFPGLLGTLTAAFLIHLGVHASRVLLCYDFPKSRISRWIVLGFVTVSSY